MMEKTTSPQLMMRVTAAIVSVVLFFVSCSSVPQKSVETIIDAETSASSSAKESNKSAPQAEPERGSDKSLSFGIASFEEERVVAERNSEASSYSSTPREATPSESGLKAGYSDDNEQFNYFINFLDQYGPEVTFYPLNIAERIIITVKDASGKPVSNADVTVQIGSKTVSTGRTYASGVFQLYPLEYPDATSYKVIVSYGAERINSLIKRDGPRNVEIKLANSRKIQKEVPLDILFILDTTGSMGEEIERLRSTIEIINANVSTVTPKPLVRFALVLYRDVDDEYLTTVVPFTSNMDSFQKSLNEITADGGGDSPEDLQSALKDALTKLNWNTNGLRLAFTITDAEPHLDYEQDYTYAEAARDAKAKGIKLFSVGTGGLPLQGEYILRQISQFTAARYIFLTYGEKGESEGGSEASVSHHTGSNFQSDKLETIIIRFTREELAFLSDTPLVLDEPYFDAKKVGSENTDETLSTLFKDALSNLTDYSTYSVGSGTKAVLLPIGLADSDSSVELKRQAEYFSEAMLLSAIKNKPFVIMERTDLQKILDEQKLQYSGLVDDDSAVRLGAFLGAEVLVSGRLYLKDGKYEIFLKLLRVETGEILSVSKAKLTKDLGI